MKKFIAAATLALMATTAQAASFTSYFGAPDPGPVGSQTVVFDFEAATPELSGNYSLVTGSVSGQYAAPALDTTQFAVVPADGSPAPGVALIDLTGFGQPIRSISLYWGSIDQYNTLEFLDGDTVVLTITGGLLPPANGNQGDGDTNRRVNALFGAGEQNLTALRFTSTGKAFEFDDIAIAGVPEPQSWLMLIMGFGLIGAANRRRARATSVTA
jgi:PEP-CTERM motif